LDAERPADAFCGVCLSVLLCAQALTPQITENKRKTEDLLREAYTLQTCLSQRVSASILEKLLPKRYKQYMKGIGSTKA
jgi:MoxR-like ATPase